jgi:hypothetical protein
VSPLSSFFFFINAFLFFFNIRVDDAWPPQWRIIPWTAYTAMV